MNIPESAVALVLAVPNALLTFDMAVNGYGMTFQCRLCGSTNIRELFIAQEYPICKCGDCDIVFTGKSFKAEEQAEFYKTRYYAAAADYAAKLKQSAMSDNEDHQERVKAISKMILKKKGSVLDVGCAAGALLAAFKSAGWECYGIEPSADLAAYARTAVGCEVHEGLLESSDLPFNNFDAVTALHVLEHTSNPLAFLKRCHKLLRKGGILLIEVPDFGSTSARTKKESWLPLYPDTHLFHFTDRTLIRLLTDAGFRVERLRRYGGLGALAPTALKSVKEENSFCNFTSNRTCSIDRAKEYIFVMRKYFYRVPAIKKLIRYFYWHVFGMNDFMRSYARKI